MHRGHLPLGRHLLVLHDLPELLGALEFGKLSTTDPLESLVDLSQDLQLALGLVQSHTLEEGKGTDPSCTDTEDLQDSPLGLEVERLALRRSGGRA